MIIPMLCVTIFVILVVWFLLPRVARLMIHTPTAISIFVCLSMVQLMAVFISMRCTLCGHFLQVALTLILVVGYAIAASYIACKVLGLMVTVCPSQFATRRTLFHFLVGCGLLMLFFFNDTATTEIFSLSLHDALPISVRESDIVCLAAHSPTPVIRSEWVKLGAHVSSVGYYPPHGELPKDLAREHRLFVETLDAFQPPPVGCGELAGLDASTGTTLGAVALGRKPGRLTDAEITVYKAMGVAMEDMIAANLAYQSAKREGGGGVMAW